MDKINLGQWEVFVNEIQNYLKMDNISNFQNWAVIKNTMIAGVDLIEYEELIKSKFWNFWFDNLSESVLKPNSFYLFPASSTNNVHHAYSLNVMMEYLDQTLNQFNTIIEFGGGYGNMARLFRKCGHKDDYIIYDIPELLEIQKYYLTENSIDDISFKQGFDCVDDIKGNSLFLGLWSITETPIDERKIMLENLGFFKCKNIFLAMGDNFYGEDNIKWLYDEIVPRLNELGYSHNLKKIKHGNGMYYFIAKLSV